MIVAKVGGSLYDDPRLGPALRLWLSEQPEPVLLVPGGGDFADAVRKLDRIHQLGEEAAHWLAIRSMSLAGGFLEHMIRPSPCTILDPYAFFREHDLTPHTWAVTSDSLSAAVALHHSATRLVLLKSIDIQPDTPWAVAADRGWVDAHFPTLIGHTSMPVEAINFRRWMKIRFPDAGDELP